MHDNQKITFVCDPLLSEHGPLRPAILMAREFMKKGKRIKIISTTISAEQQRKLSLLGIETVDLGKTPLLKRNESLAWLEEWVREAVFNLNSRGLAKPDGVIVNFANTLCLPAHAWYAQGPPTVTLDNMRAQLPLLYRMIYEPASPAFKVFDKSFTRKMAQCSTHVVANSRYLASIYGQLGVRASHVIYPPLDCEQFKPTTSEPSRDFVLTYFGKETIFSLVEGILDMGIRVKAFGGKLSMIPKRMLGKTGLELLGRVSDEELIDLYSNALYTFYPFTDEPFGYIPIESLACGTPVLTFDRQGPKETVENGRTGWLAADDASLLRLARRVWQSGYSEDMRENCRQSSLKYEATAIAKEWSELLS
jgi:glycosyltransferase involved in cell wall biosynthesis